LAVPVYEKLLQLDPENTGAMNNFGISLLHLGQWVRAEEIYRKSIGIDSSNYFSHFGLLQTLVAQKKYKEALEESKICLKLNPDSREVQKIYSKLSLMVDSKNP
jgi:tetratricopeptide (TPR) repeat protein